MFSGTTQVRLEVVAHCPISDSAVFNEIDILAEFQRIGAGGWVGTAFLRIF